MEQEVAPKLNFIRDVAADIDFFGSHERIADAIATVISSNDDLKVIGLLGRWGSGKSTVVRHVQKCLNAKDKAVGTKTHVFCYDAWLHQSDPPRRSFLETFVAFLDAEKLTTSARWQPQLEVLNRQVEDTETTTSPSLTKMGWGLLATIALIPLGMKFIGRDWYEARSAPGGDFVMQGGFYLGCVLVALPFLIAILIGLFGKQERGSLLALFVNRQIHKHSSRVTRTPEPTTIEFQKTFRDIIAGLPTGKRLILVIDNLDRLHEAEAVAMWNTIRSFFLGSEHADRTSRTANLPTVLLPIDQEAVERMYRKEHGELLGKRLARSFMDKTFDLAFHVRPPVLSDWNRYLSKQLRAVFGEELDENWAYQVGRLYEAQSAGGHEITPRSINVTINDIATLWLQWRDEIPFVTIAYFVIFYEAIEGNIYMAVSQPLVHIADLDPEWQRGIAALHYGAPRDKAIQVLLEPRLRAAHEEWDANEYQSLAGLPGFQETLQRVLDGARPVAPRFIAQATYLLTELKPEPAAWVSSAWSALREAYLEGQHYGELDESDVAALKVLLNNCPAQHLPRFLSRAVTKFRVSFEQIFFADGNSRQRYIELVEALLAAAKAHNLPTPEITFVGDTESYLETIQYSADKPDVVRAIKLAGNPQDIVKALTTQIASTEGGSVEAKFKAVVGLDRKFDWKPLIEASRKILEQSATGKGSLAAITILGHFWKDMEAAQTAVQALAEQGHLNARIGESYDPSRYTRMAQLIALAVLNDTALANPGGNTWTEVLRTAPDMPERVRIAMDRFDDSGTIHHLVKASTQAPDALPLCRAIFSKKVENSTIGSLYIGEVIDQLPDYLNCLDGDYKDVFIRRLANYGTLWAEIDKRDLNENTRHILRVLSITSGVSAETQKSARAMLKSHLKSTSKSIWRTAVQNGTEPLPIAKALANALKRPLNAGPQLVDALNGMLQALAVDDTPAWAGRWFEGAELLSSAARKAVHRYLRDRLFTGSVTIGLPPLLGLASDAFFEDAEFASRGDSTVRHIVSPMLDSDAGILWLGENDDRVRTWVAAAPEDARTFLKEQAQHRLSEGDELKRKRIRSLLGSWSL